MIECQRHNMILPLQALREAKDKGEPFVLISSDIVFDRSVNRVYYETSSPNTACQAGKMLAETEKHVLGYDQGKVFRAQDLMSRVLPFFDVYMGHPSRYCSVADETVHLLSDMTLELVIRVFAERFDVPNLIHCAGGWPFDLSLICYSLVPDSTFDMNGTPETFVYRGSRGYLRSKFFSSAEYIAFHNHIMGLNRHLVEKELNERGKCRQER